MIAVGWRPIIDETGCPACHGDGRGDCANSGVVPVDPDGDITDTGELTAIYDTDTDDYYDPEGEQ